MQYQYLGMFENYQLQCPKCNELFLARAVHSSAPSNGAGGLGWQFDPHQQDFGSNNQPASAVSNGARNDFKNGGQGGLNSIPKHVSSAAFFSSAAAAAAQLRARVEAAATAADAAFNATPRNNLVADEAQQTFDKVKREGVEAEEEIKREEQEREREKVKRKEAEVKRTLEEVEREAEVKRKLEEVEREAEVKRKLEEVEREKEVKRKLEEVEREKEVKRKLEEVERDKEVKRKLEEVERDKEVKKKQEVEKKEVEVKKKEEFKRREDEAKRKEEELRKNERDELRKEKEEQRKAQVDKRSREAMERFVAKKKEQEKARDARAARKLKRKRWDSQREDDEDLFASKGFLLFKRWTKRSREKRRVDECRLANEINRGDQGGTVEKDPQSPNSVSKRSDSSPRKSKLDGTSSVTHRTKGGKSPKQAEFTFLVKENDLDEDFRAENSQSKSPRTFRNRIRSPKVPFGSQTVHIEEGQMLRQPAPILTQSPGSSPSLETDSEEDVGRIVVQDADFHDFDKYRTETDFLPGQVWAIYDDQYAMPRFYARISKVSTKPFRAYINWLDYSAPSDNDSAGTESTDQPVPCGEFKMRRTTTAMDRVNIFSHMVMEKSEKGTLKIYPKKGQVWAVYRDWDTEQRIGFERVAKCKGESPYTYEVVEILSEFSNDESLKAVKLLKHLGFKTVFSRQEGVEAVRYFKPTELAKFSHNVPYQRIDDVVADVADIPLGSLELDPASVPLSLITSHSNSSKIVAQ